MIDQYAAAERIANAHPRRVAEAWCSHGHSPKLVAAVVVHEAALWLWVVGGRSGSHAEMVAEWQRNIDDITADLADFDRRGIPLADRENHRQALIEFEGVLSRWKSERLPAYTPARAWPLETAHWSDVVACRGCRRDVRVTLTKEDGFTVERVARPPVS